MGTILYFKQSVTAYQPASHNIPEERRPHFEIRRVGAEAEIRNGQLANTSLGISCLTQLVRMFYALVIAQVKVNFTLEQAMKAHRGSRGTALLIL
jgi:hypothetical protein